MAARKNVEKFIQGMTPNLTKRFGTSSSKTKERKLKAGVAQGVANRKRAAEKAGGAEGPKRSVAKKKTPKITKVPSKYNVGASNTKISLPKSGTRTVSNNAGGRTRITSKNSSGKTVMTGSSLSYTAVPKRGNVRLTTPKKSKMKYGNR